MKIAKRVLIAFLVYVCVVVAFESLLGFFQPANQATLVIATADQDGERRDRIVSRLESDGKIYVAANHWPRAWFRRALANPDVLVTLDQVERDAAGANGEGPKPYRAIQVSGEEREHVARENSLPVAFRVLTGFPPRLFMRLDPS